MTILIKPAERIAHIQEYYFSKKLQEIRGLNKQGYDILNLGIGSPDMMPSEETIESLVRSSRNPKHHGYQPYRGIAELRDSISHWSSKTYKVDLNPETEILPLMGSKEGITHISLAYINPGDSILVPELGYPAYKAVAEMVGGEVDTYPLLEDENWSPDFNFLESIEKGKYRLLWLNYPHMPTGTPPDKAIFDRLVEIAIDKEILLCHDNPYSMVLNENDPQSLLFSDKAFEVAVELNSLSKSHNMAGWRLGWVSGRKEYIDAILKIKSNFDSGMFRGIQEAGIAALENSSEWHQKRNNVYSERRELAYQVLGIIGCTWGKGQIGMFVWAKIPDNISNVEEWIDHILYTYKVFITPGFIFGKAGGRFIRISLCSDSDTYLEAMRRLKDYKT